MKTVRISFIEPAHRAILWRIVLVFVLGYTAVVGYALWESHQVYAREQDALAEIDQELASARRPPPGKADPREASTARALKLMRADLNKAFLPVEGLVEPGAVLRSMVIDQASDTLRVEYTLATVESIARITSQLNTGYDAAPWTLETAMASPGLNNSGKAELRAVWTARFSRL